MKDLRFLTFCLLNFLLITFAVAPKPARADDPVAFQFAQTDALVLSWEKGSGEFEILNNTTSEYWVAIQISNLKNSEGKVLKTSDVLQFEQSVRVPAAGSVNVKIGVDTKPVLQPGIYEGTLTVSEKASDTVIRRSIQIEVLEEGAAPREAPKPLVDKWTVHAYRLLPFPTKLPVWVYQHRERFLPLDVGAEKEPALDKETPLGYLAGENGGVATVSWTGDLQLQEQDNNKLGIKLYFEGLDRPGKYESEIDLLPDDKEAGTVTLTVNVTDIILWPIAFLGIGIWVAVKVQQYVGVFRKIWKLTEREATLGIKFKEAQQTFATNSVGKSYASYSIAEDLEKRREQLRKVLEERKSHFPTLDEEDDKYRVEVLEPLELMETQIKAWGSFANDLEGLRTALVKEAEPAIKAAKHPPKQAFAGLPEKLDEHEPPRFYPEANRLLEGKGLSLEEFKALRERVDKATTLAKSWGALDERVQKIRAGIRKLLVVIDRSGSHSDKELLYEARRKMNSAWTDLWLATDADDLKRREAQAELEWAQGALLQLIHYFEALPPGGDWTEADWSGEWISADRSALLMAFSQPASIAIPAQLPAEDEDRARYVKNARLQIDRALVWLTLGIALLTGLGTLYFDKNFGSLRDYINALVWGMGTKAAMEAGNVTLERILGLRAGD